MAEQVMGLKPLGVRRSWRRKETESQKERPRAEGRKMDRGSEREENPRGEGQRLRVGQGRRPRERGAQEPRKKPAGHCSLLSGWGTGWGLPGAVWASDSESLPPLP